MVPTSLFMSVTVAADQYLSTAAQPSAAQSHPPGSFPNSHLSQNTPKPGPIRTKEDRSLSGNAFSMGTPALGSPLWNGPAASTSAAANTAAGGVPSDAGGDVEALKRLAELEKQLEENLRLQEAQGGAPKGGGEKEKEPAAPAAGGWFPKLW